MTELLIRKATVTDVPTIRSLIQELAIYEKLEPEMRATEAQLATALFSDTPDAEVVMAEYKREAAGFALFFHNFSTFVGKRGLYLEDLFVREHLRGKGIGFALISHLAKLALERDCGRLEWSVLDWNTPAIDFYRAIGAQGMNGWTTQRLSDDALHALASSALPETSSP